MSLKEFKQGNGRWIQFLFPFKDWGDLVLKKILFLLIYILLFSQFSESTQLFSAEEGELLVQGHVIDRLRLSQDGKWITYTQYSQDIGNNEVWMVSTESGESRILDTPYGYKNTPVIWGGEMKDGKRLPYVLFCSYANSGRGTLKDGIYTKNLEVENAEWRLWQAGSFRNLSFSHDLSHLMASTGKWNQAKPRSRVVVWELTEDGMQESPPYYPGQGVIGLVKKIVMTPDKRNLYFSCIVDDPESYYGVFNLYETQNKSDSRATLLLEKASEPCLKPDRFSDKLIYQDYENNIVIRDLRKQENEDASGYPGFSFLGMEYSQKTQTLYYCVQNNNGDLSALLKMEY